MTYFATRSEQEYRDLSNNPKMAGVTMPSWRCGRCKKTKPLKGRKSLGPRKGFQCADCANKKSNL